MNKKQKEAKRKNAQAHQKKVKELDVLRLQNRVDRKQLITRELFKADRVIVETPRDPIDAIMTSHGLVTPGNFLSLERRPEIPAGMAKELEVLLALADLCPTCNSK